MAHFAVLPLYTTLLFKRYVIELCLPAGLQKQLIGTGRIRGPLLWKYLKQKLQWNKAFDWPQSDSGKLSDESGVKSSTLITLYTVELGCCWLPLKVYEIRPQFPKTLDVVRLSCMTCLCDVAYESRAVPLDEQIWMMASLFKRTVHPLVEPQI